MIKKAERFKEFYARKLEELGLFESYKYGTKVICKKRFMQWFFGLNDIAIVFKFPEQSAEGVTGAFDVDSDSKLIVELAKSLHEEFGIPCRVEGMVRMETVRFGDLHPINNQKS